MLNREPIEKGILDFCAQEGIGFIAFSPLAQGLLTDRYLDGIPADSRMAKEHFLTSDRRTPELLAYLRQLEAQGKASGRTIAQEALQWLSPDDHAARRWTAALFVRHRPVGRQGDA